MKNVVDKNYIIYLIILITVIYCYSKTSNLIITKTLERLLAMEVWHTIVIHNGLNEVQDTILIPRDFTVNAKNHDKAIKGIYTSKEYSNFTVAERRYNFAAIKSYAIEYWIKLISNEKVESDHISKLNEQHPIISIKSKYGITPGYITGDTISMAGREGVYYIPESINMNDITVGTRNRGDYKQLLTEGGIVTAFTDFKPKNTVKETAGTYIGVDGNGKFKAGNISEFDANDLVSKTFVNRIKEFKVINKSKHLIVKMNVVNDKYSLPVVTIINDKGVEIKSTIDIFTRFKSGDTSIYGNRTGGRVIFRVGNEVRLVSGSIDHLLSEFNAMKARNSSEYIDIYSLDNGPFNLGIRTKNKILSKKDLLTYDAQNKYGGNFIYIINKNPVTFKSDTTYTPNIRTINDESYKKGHALVNEDKGVVLHHTTYDDSNLEKVTDYMNKSGSNSSHVVINFNGDRRVFAVPEKVTFHSGESSWNGRENVNDFMVGLEFQGDTNKKPLTNEQIQSAVEYLKPIIRKYNINIEDITTHAKVREAYNEYAKKKASIKSDITIAEYNKILFALIDNVYYKKIY
jgi:hypothetical protein